MNTASPDPRSPHATARCGVLAIVAIYAVLAALWVFLSDQALSALVSDPAELTRYGTLKGWAFVAVTALLLWALIRCMTGELQRAQQSREAVLEDKLRTLKVLDAIVTSSTDAIFVKDLNGHYQICNQAVGDLVGKPAAEILGRDDFAIMTADNAAKIRADDRQVIASNAHRTYEDRLMTPAGERVLLTTKGPLHDAQGRVTGIFGIARDITRRNQAEEALRQSEARYRALFEANPHPMWVYDATTLAFLAVNDAAIAHYGYSREEFLAMTLLDIRPADELPRFMGAQAAMPPSGVSRSGLWRHLRKDGSEILVELTSHDLEFDARPARAVLAHDVTERERARATIELNAKVFEQGSEGILICNAESKIITANRAVCETTGYSLAELIGQNPSIFKSGRHDRDFYRQMWAQVENEGHWQGEVWNRRKTGEIYPEWLTISTVRNGGGRITHYVGIASDITEHKQAEAHIRHLAHYDALTGLPNRSLLNDRIEQAIHQAQRDRHCLALLFLDVDRFKNVNDSLGHPVGDQMLVAIGARLLAAVRGEDTVSRLGGDEFILLLPNADTDGAAHVADKIIRGMAEPFQIEGVELTITPSIGIAMYPADGETIESLLQSADAAMYRAKEDGRNGFRFFTPEMHRQSSRTLLLENGLRRALERGQLHLVYQPQVDLRSGRIVGCEALLRWQHPELGAISPAEFIPIAEDSGQILAIGEWVLRTAIAQARAWQDAGLPPLVMAVNISAAQFHHVDLTTVVTRTLLEGGLAPEHLELELTESITMKDPESAIGIIERLHHRGIQLSIDDFGTGYSSLSYLKRLKVAKLKIDQSFVRDIAQDGDSEAIVGAIIQLARSLGLQTIAEGVETGLQVEFLRDKGCQQIQGYHVSRPIAAPAFEAFLRAWTARGADALPAAATAAAPASHYRPPARRASRGH